MPFLFVDYDQGAGGEYFCANLSRSPQCTEMKNVLFGNGRTNPKLWGYQKPEKKKKK